MSKTRFYTTAAKLGYYNMMGWIYAEHDFRLDPKRQDQLCEAHKKDKRLLQLLFDHGCMMAYVYQISLK